MNHVILITGLGSSLPLLGRIWSAWAVKLEKRLIKEFSQKDLRVTIVSSDGAREDQVYKILNKYPLGKVIIVGHSNGFRDGLYMADRLGKVDYFAGIDMTLDDRDVRVTSGIKIFHEFHAILNKAKFANPSLKDNAGYWRIKKGHTAAASDKFVQDTIFRTIKRVLR